MATGFEVIAKGALGAVVKGRINKLLKARAREATQIVLEELRNADLHPDDVADRDDVASMLVTFYLAMVQGAATRNLRTIGKVLAHKAAHPEKRPDDFIMWSNAISSLLHEEAVLLATLFLETELAMENTPEGENAVDLAVKRTKEKLVGPARIIKSDDEFYGIASALSRTGFVVLLSAFGGISLKPSPRLTRLAEMANIQAWAEDLGDAA